MARACGATGRAATAARAELADDGTASDPAVLITRALLASAPFITVAPAELGAARAELERWEVSAPAPGGEPGSWSVLHEGLLPHLRAYLLGILAARLGDAGAASQHAAEIATLEAPDEASGLVHDLALSVRARNELAANRPEEALAMLRDLRMETRFDLTFSSPFLSQAAERFVLAELLHRLGRTRESIPWLESFAQNSVYDLVYVAPAQLRLGRIRAEDGSPDEAARHYRRFATLWNDCDADLKPLVDDAQRALKRPETIGPGTDTI